MGGGRGRNSGVRLSERLRETTRVQLSDAAIEQLPHCVRQDMDRIIERKYTRPVTIKQAGISY